MVFPVFAHGDPRCCVPCFSRRGRAVVLTVTAAYPLLVAPPPLPDRHTASEESEKKKAEAMFKDVNEAYEVLSDAEKRRR